MRKKGEKTKKKGREDSRLSMTSIDRAEELESESDSEERERERER